MARHSTLQQVKQGALLSKGSTLTIASNTITVTDSFHLVATSDPDNTTTENLTTINGGHTAGQVVVLMAANDAETVKVKNSASLAIGADTDLADDTDTITLMWTGSKWVGLASRVATTPS
mgnify:CR=1 FL=1